jgi:hypothetical protein
VSSIMERGILSHARAKRFKHFSVAMPEIQERRATKKVPGGKPLHEYANLYICARNPMLCKVQDRHLHLAVLQVSTDVLDLPGVVIADRNASIGYALFKPSPQGLTEIDEADVFAEWWTDLDPIERSRKKGVKCAEVLVPDRVDPQFILGAYVSCGEAEKNLLEAGFPLRITINGHMFFR